jgi:hypothetical protein
MRGPQEVGWVRETGVETYHTLVAAWLVDPDRLVVLQELGSSLLIGHLGQGGLVFLLALALGETDVWVTSQFIAPQCCR